MSIQNKKIVLSFLIVAFTFIIYFQVYNYNFVYDDFSHIHDNIENIKKGFTLEGISWAFKSTYAANWHPVTWLLYLFDYQISGLNVHSYHITNIVFHILNSLLLFFLFCKLTGSVYNSFLVAILFAIHPMHIESVAWISGRKDLLSAFFGFLCIYYYLDYAKTNSLKRYFISLFSFILSLMSKSMLVTMPFIFLLLDYYPLKRKISFKLIYEKLPFFLLTIFSSIITIIAQKNFGAVASLKYYSLLFRFKNALLSYFLYIKKAILPFDLTVFYLSPQNISILQLVLCSIFFLMPFYLGIKYIKKAPCLFVSWSFYIGTLLPVIGLVKVGEQGMADRYSYIPLIGIFVLIVWGGEAVIKKFYKKDLILKIVSFFIIIFFTVISFFQVQYWQNELILFRRVLDVNPKTYTVYNNLGFYFLRNKKYNKAIEYFKSAIKGNRNNILAHYNLGVAFDNINNFEKAIKSYENVLLMDPNHINSLNNLGVIYFNKKMYINSLHYFKKLIELKPYNTAYYYNILSTIYLRLGKKKEAIICLKKAVQLEPNVLSYRSMLRTLLNEKYGL